MQLTFCPLFSGSSGNCAYVEAGNTRILIDAGISGKAVTEALAQIDVLPETIQGILITHEHSDHVKAAGILSRKYRIPIYANEPTWNAMARQIGDVWPGQRRIFDSGEDFFIGDLSISSFQIPHDAAEPVGYRVFAGGHSVSTATDMGYLTKDVLKRIAGSDIVLLESNHDPDMLLQNPRYSQTLKKRILGRFGHLSNEMCAEGILKLYETGVRHIVLGHLSAENNTPELALETSVRMACDRGILIGQELFIDMAWRDRVGGLYTVD